MRQLFLSCPGGLESVCRDELEALGIHSLEELPGGVRFEGDLETIYRVNLHSRVGMRLLVELADFKCRNQQDLYEGAIRYNWSGIMEPDQTFAVRGYLHKFHPNLKNSQFAALKIKDAIVDRFRRKTGKRPSVDRQRPQVEITYHITPNRCILYMNSSGAPLSKRHYRRGLIHKASLNESLAAGIIRLTGWDMKSPFYDPMCGSGTLPIEALMMAVNYPPGLLRQHFAFKTWKDHDEDQWQSIREKGEKQINKHVTVSVFGSDIRRDNVKLALRNAESLGPVSRHIRWNTQSIGDFYPESSTGTIVMNLPYGDRIGDFGKLTELYKETGDILKTRCTGHTAGLFTGNLELAKHVGLKTSRRIPLKNGNIDCRLLIYKLYEGSRKSKYEQK